jgi:outer membrane protease
MILPYLVKIFPSIFLSVSLYYSPFVVIEAIDNHYLKSMKYQDIVFCAQNISLVLGLHWKVGSLVFLFKVFFENTFLAAGLTQATITTTGTTTPFSEGSGVSYSAVNIELSVMCIIF